MSLLFAAARYGSALPNFELFVPVTFAALAPMVYLVLGAFVSHLVKAMVTELAGIVIVVLVKSDGRILHFRLSEVGVSCFEAEADADEGLDTGLEPWCSFLLSLSMILSVILVDMLVLSSGMKDILCLQMRLMLITRMERGRSKVEVEARLSMMCSQRVFVERAVEPYCTPHTL